MKFIKIILMILLLSGCNPLRPEKLQLPDPPDSYSIEQPLPATQLEEQWWKDFHDLQLDQLQQQLFCNNLNLRQAIYRLQQLEMMKKINRANRWPQLTLNGTLKRDSLPALPNDTITTTERFSIAAGYEVDLWNRLSDKAKAAEFRYQAGENDVRTLLLSLSAQLADQYFLAVEQRGQLALLEQQTVQKEGLLKIFTDRYRAGLTTATEVYKARQNLATVKSLVPDRRASLARAENNIALLLGQAPGTVSIQAEQLPQLTNLVDIGLPADLLLRRPDIAAATQQLAAADHELAAALAARLPAVNLTAAIGHSATKLAVGDIEGTFWNLALGLTQPIFDGGRRKAESQRQKAIREEKFAAWQQIFLTALQEVETALISEVNAGEKSRRLEQQRRINAQTLKLTRDNYLNGLTDSRDLLLSQFAQIDILRQQLTTHRQQLSQRISLARALGGSWMAAELDHQRAILQQQDENHD